MLSQPILQKLVAAEVTLICGPTASGKTTLADWIGHQLGVSILAMDRYFRDLAQLASVLSENDDVVSQWDSPSAYDFERLVQDIGKLLEEGRTQVPVYCFRNQARIGVEDFSLRRPGKIVVEGLYAARLAKEQTLATRRIVSVFLFAGEETRFNRLRRRDPREKGIPLEKVEDRLVGIREAERRWILSQEQHCQIRVVSENRANGKSG